MVGRAAQPDDGVRCDFRPSGRRRGPAALTGAQAAALDAAVSADGQRLALAAFSGACCVIDLELLGVAWTELPDASVQWIINPVHAIPRLLQWDGADLLVVVAGTRKVLRRDRQGAARKAVELDATLPSSWLRPATQLVSAFYEERDAVGLFEIEHGELRYRGEKEAIVRTQGEHRSVGLLVTPEGRFAIAVPGEGPPRTVVVDAVKKTQRVVAEKNFIAWQWIAPLE